MMTEMTPKQCAVTNHTVTIGILYSITLLKESRTVLVHLHLTKCSTVCKQKLSGKPEPDQLKRDGTAFETTAEQYSCTRQNKNRMTSNFYGCQPGKKKYGQLFLRLLLSGTHRPLGVHSTKHRHWSPEWMILNHVSCFIQGEVIGFQLLLSNTGSEPQICIALFPTYRVGHKKPSPYMSANYVFQV